TGTSDESFLDDAAALAEGLIALYESTGDARWLMEALALQRTLDTRFRDAGAGGYFLTPEGARPSLAREKPGDDGAVPSGNSIAAMNLLRLGALTGDDALRKRALEVLSAFASVLPRMPAMLAALDSSLDDSLELVVVRPRADAGDALVEVARKVYLPAAVLAIATEGADLAAQAKVVPIVQDKRALRGLATAFVCSRGVCDLPTSDPAALERRLSRARPLFRGQEGPAPLPVR
ncbi:MAG TPA: thioredoxin domain-containing protein, partial [Myxococcales bacterium]|nr:thioredoxin domain-containing protein [Myxococcales bacterium]